MKDVLPPQKALRRTLMHSQSYENNRRMRLVAYNLQLLPIIAIKNDATKKTRPLTRLGQTL